MITLRSADVWLNNVHPMPYEAATQMEMDSAEDLRRAGYTGTGGH